MVHTFKAFAPPPDPIPLDLKPDGCIMELGLVAKKETDQLRILRICSGYNFYWYDRAKRVYPLSPADRQEETALSEGRG
jgi:hypothetical protein